MSKLTKRQMFEAWQEFKVSDPIFANMAKNALYNTIYKEWSMSQVKFDLPKDSHQQYDLTTPTYTIPVAGTWSVDGKIKVYYKAGDVVKFDTSLTKIGNVPECEHEMVAYNGLTESYNFCKKCDKKENV